MSRPLDHINDGGFVKSFRRVYDGDSVLGTDRRLIGAWFEMIAKAAYEPTDVQIGETWIKLERGQLMISLREYAKLWHVPWSTFWRACKAMESSGRIRLEVKRVRAKVEPTRTLVTICNYARYQAPILHDGPTVNQGWANPYKEEKESKTLEILNPSCDSVILSPQPLALATTPKPNGSGNGHDRPKATTRGCRMPEDWDPGEAGRAWARAELKNPVVSAEWIEEETEKCRDWAWSTSGAKATKCNWNRFWKNWLRTGHGRLRDAEIRERRYRERFQQQRH